jgi:hypothetical protein
MSDISAFFAGGAGIVKWLRLLVVVDAISECIERAARGSRLGTATYFGCERFSLLLIVDLDVVRFYADRGNAAGVDGRNLSVL